MNIKSLGNRMDLAAPNTIEHVIDHGDHITVVTPSFPDYYWGNFIAFPNPPGSGDYARWTTLYKEEVESRSKVEHVAFSWDAADGRLGDVDAFLEAGFKPDICNVMVTDRLIEPPRYDSNIQTRPVETEEEWTAAAWCGSYYGELVERINPRVQQDQLAWKAVAERGDGYQYGAFLHDTLVGVVGIFRFEGGAVLDSVVTHPNHRGKGVASSMVYDASRHARSALKVDQLMLATEEDSDAERIYRRIGFTTVEKQVGVLKAS